MQKPTLPSIPACLACLLCAIISVRCEQDTGTAASAPSFYAGADLSFVNQIVDHGGLYRTANEITDPFEIFGRNGVNLVRLRLWHNPVWTREVYGGSAPRMYSDLADTEKAIRAARENGMNVLLDFHYSDTWADPGKQHIPAAWETIRDAQVLADSVYNYTKQVLTRFSGLGLEPALVQVGNETNCGMLYTDAPPGFPSCNVCDGQWKNAGLVWNAAIRAIRETLPDTRILLHVADPKHVTWWFANMQSQAGVTDFDMIGFSYYPLWHTAVSLEHISDSVQTFRERFKRDVMVLETAYPWTTEGADDYNNLFGSQKALDGLPFSEEGQYLFLVRLADEILGGGGKGFIYWEPAWITSGMKDLWGTGSSWENCALFDFQGNSLKGMDAFSEYGRR